MPDELLAMKVWKEYRWILKQRELSGLGKLDFKVMVRQTSLSAKYDQYMSNRQVIDTPVDDLPSEVLIGGLITDFQVKGTDRKFVTIQMSDGETLINGVIWNDTYLKHKELFENHPIDKLMILTAAIKYDGRYKKQNVFNTSDRSKIVIVEG
jgi:DNA polymerase III alpha subunit